MDLRDHVSAELPIYYDERLERGLPFVPFMVAPLERFQDTLIVGPQAVGKSHDEFIDRLYQQIRNSNLKGMGLRAFVFRSRICVAVLLPTPLSDEAGRAGLPISLGFFTRGTAFSLRTSVLPECLRIYLELLSSTFKLSLPHDGASRLLEVIRDAYNGSEDVKSLRVGELMAVLNSLFTIAATAGDLYRSRRRWTYLRWRRPRKLPKVILYEADSNYDDLLQVFFRELDVGIRRVGTTAIQQPFKENDGMDFIALLPLSTYLAKASSVRLKKYRGKSFLSIF
jgi:hypothetical protein